jgi:tetratricopeptide (TPR) repeat protein
VEPFTTAALAAIGANVSANLVTNAIQGLTKVVIEKAWAKADELGRLFYLMESAFSDELPAITHEELERTWRMDAAFFASYSRLTTSANSGAELAQLAAAIEPLVGATQTETSAQLAQRLAAAIPALLFAAKDDNQQILQLFREMDALLNSQHDQVIGQLTRIDNKLGARQNVTLIFSSDWPSAVEDAMQRAGEADAEGLAALTDALKGTDVGSELDRLVRAPRDWMKDLSAALWEVIAVMCEEHGLWERAKDAWLVGRGKSGADFAGYTVRAAEAAAYGGDRDTAQALLEEARADEPTHPRVLFQDAVGIEDPHEGLAALDRISTDDKVLAGMVLLAKAGAYVELEDVEKAREFLAAAREAGAENTVSYRMTDQTTSVVEVLQTPQPSAPRVAELVETSLELERELLARNQLTQAAGVRAQAAAFHGFVNDYDEAAQVLADGVDTYNVDAPEPRLVLAMAAANLHRNEVVEALVRDDDDRQTAKYLRGVLGSEGDDAAKEAAAAVFDSFLTSEHADLRGMAALRRLQLAGETPNIDWSTEAEALTIERAHDAAAVFKAYWLENTGRAAEAETELLKHSDHVWALIELMKLAGRTEDWASAAKYATSLLGRDRDWSSQLFGAEALQRGDRTPDAMREFDRLASAADAPVAMRLYAFRMLAERAFNGKDFTKAREVGQKMLELDQHSEDAAWLVVLASAMLGNDTDALDLIKSRGLRPRRPDEYRIASQLYLSIGDPVEAVRAIVSYDDEQNPPDERLEHFAISAGLRAGSALPQEFEERLRLDRFVEMFPDSEWMRTGTFEDLIHLIEVEGPKRVGRIQNIEARIMGDGDIPTAVLASAMRVDMGALWARLVDGIGLPLSYGHDELSGLELQDALQAVGGPVLWDSTSVFVVDHLLSELSDTIRTAFPVGHITQSALSDIADGARVLEVSAETTEIGVDTDAGRLAFSVQTAEEIAKSEKRAKSALEFAHKLTVVPDADPENPQKEDMEPDPLWNGNGIPALFASFGVARRTPLVLFSDDRDVRRLARIDGLASFGTLAALDALVAKGVLDAAQRDAARVALLRNHAVGLRPTSDELAAMGRAAGWTLTSELATAMRDRAAWTMGLAETVQSWLAFMQLVHREAPAQLDAWVARFLIAIEEGRPAEPIHVHAQRLVTLALVLGDPESAAFVRALLSAMDGSRQFLSAPLGDPGIAGFLAYLGILAQYPERDLVSAFAGRVWTMLPMDAQPDAAQYFAQFLQTVTSQPSPDEPAET